MSIAMPLGPITKARVRQARVSEQEKAVSHTEKARKLAGKGVVVIQKLAGKGVVVIQKLAGKAVVINLYDAICTIKAFEVGVSRSGPNPNGINGGRTRSFTTKAGNNGC